MSTLGALVIGDFILYNHLSVHLFSEFSLTDNLTDEITIYKYHGALDINEIITERLPAVAGRFLLGVVLNIIEDDLIGNISRGSTKVTPRPKSFSPISLTKLRKFLLDLS